ncbi:hypothetical protein F511_36950 [Dorcoceras hygrometricum]|uniref:Uncharacterized protein n=1 Tax=Dorcoceras hygrometricum TaxID=472368 RepID=A0A2Z7CPD7_9LAMI|nr:hypothetical protein F511_36950 [Dorcoceras hygrometricum]
MDAADLRDRRADGVWPLRAVAGEAWCKSLRHDRRSHARAIVALLVSGLCALWPARRGANRCAMIDARTHDVAAERALRRTRIFRWRRPPLRRVFRRCHDGWSEFF